MVEIILAVFILMIGLVGIAAFYTKSFQISKTARNQTIAANLAAAVLDQELSLAYSSIDSVSRTPYSSDTTSPFYNFEKEVTVNCLDASLQEISCATAHMKKILVTIYWQENSQSKSFQEATIMTEQ